MKNKYTLRKKIIILISVVIAVFAIRFGISYFKRHFISKNIDKVSVVSGEKLTTSKKIITVYFTRLGNTLFDENVDAVTGASLMLDNGKKVGNCELIGSMIQNIAGGDIYAISTEKQYPSTYKDTILESINEFKNAEKVALKGDIPEFGNYDTVFLVYPVWCGTIPMAVESFLNKANLSSEKNICPIAVHGGGGEGKSFSHIKSICKANVKGSISIYDDDIPELRNTLLEKVSKLLN